MTEREAHEQIYCWYANWYHRRWYTTMDPAHEWVNNQIWSALDIPPIL